MKNEYDNGAVNKYQSPSIVIEALIFPSMANKSYTKRYTSTSHKHRVHRSLVRFLHAAGLYDFHFIFLLFFSLSFSTFIRFIFDTLRKTM